MLLLSSDNGLALTEASAHCPSANQTILFPLPTPISPKQDTSHMEDLDPDLVLDMKTLRSLITTRWTSFRALRSFFLETSWGQRRSPEDHTYFNLEASSQQDCLTWTQRQNKLQCTCGLYVDDLESDTPRKPC